LDVLPLVKTKDMNTILIVVDYEEFKPETYKGCYLFDLGNKLFESNTGNFDEDYNAVGVAGENICASTGQTLVCSSSVDDWFMDNH
jgi:hypothetical protein